MLEYNRDLFDKNHKYKKSSYKRKNIPLTTFYFCSGCKKVFQFYYAGYNLKIFYPLPDLIPIRNTTSKSCPDCK